MRFISLFLIFNIALCYSGVYSAIASVAERTDEMGSHCDMANHDAADSADESQVLIQNTSATDAENSECCYEGLTNSSIEVNLDKNILAVLYLLDFPGYLDSNNSKNIDLITTRSSHDPPDIYLSVSSFLL
ncbi:MAG: hypothetical protein WD000_08525 [Thermodesulfobacteriota bacterium]